MLFSKEKVKEIGLKIFRILSSIAFLIFLIAYAILQEIDKKVEKLWKKQKD